MDAHWAISRVKCNKMSGVVIENFRHDFVRGLGIQRQARAPVHQSGKPMQLAVLSTQEMEKTEGSVAPLVAIGVMTASRFIVQRWVTQRVAQAMITRGATNVWAPSRAIASRIAGRNGIREFHAGSGARYTYFHPNPRNGSHVWYGSPR